MIITNHAAQRWCERIDRTATPETAIEAMRAHERMIDHAIAFGACSVKLGCGARLIIVSDAIVTVVSYRYKPRRRWTR